LNDLSGHVIGAAYENALALELRMSGLLVTQQCPVSVNYRGSVIGQYTVDLLVENASSK